MGEYLLTYDTCALGIGKLRSVARSNNYTFSTSYDGNSGRAATLTINPSVTTPQAARISLESHPVQMPVQLQTR